MGSGDVNNADGSFVGDDLFDPANVGFLSGVGDAGTDIDAVLHHLESVIDQSFTEIGVTFAFFLGLGRKIKCYHEPAHFEFFGVHGL